jgi:hypothetical protein
MMVCACAHPNVGLSRRHFDDKPSPIGSPREKKKKKEKYTDDNDSITIP